MMKHKWTIYRLSLMRLKNTCIKLFNPGKCVRIFHDEGEHKLWLKKASQEKFEDYLDSNIQQLSSVENPFGIGRVKNSVVWMFVIFSQIF